MAKPHSDEVKAQVMAALLAGQSVSQVAREYQLPIGTVKTWNRKRNDVVGGADEPGSSTKKDIGDLLVKYLAANLTTLEKQMKVFGDEDYLKAQPADALAVLHGVLADKAVRLLEALAPDPDPDPG